MPNSNFLVYSDGLAIESKKLLIERSWALYGGKFEKIASPIAGDPAKIGCPVSKNGHLNTTEIYTAPKDNTRHYSLPVYRITQVEAESPPKKRYQVSLEFIGEPSEKAIARLKVNLIGEIQSGSRLYPLPHDITVSLQYMVSEKTNSPGGVSTWKAVQFDEVKQKGETEIEATLHLYSLPELDYIYKVMSDEEYHCQLVIHCEADLSYPTLNQIYIRHPLPWIKLKKKPDFSDLKLETLPIAKANLAEVTRKGIKSFNYDATLDAIRVKPIKDISFSFITGVTAIKPHKPTPISLISPYHHRISILPHISALTTSGIVATHLQPEIYIHRGSRAVSPFILSDTHVISNAITPSLHILPIKDLVTYTEFSVLKDKLHKYPLNLSDSQDFMLPSHYFKDRNGDPAYVKVRASYDQKIPFNFPTSLHGYIYPNYKPQGEVALLRYQVSVDQAIYQDTTQPFLFYYLPDEFRLTREDVLPYRPALQVAFYSLSMQKENEPETDGQTCYKVEFTFKALPYLKSGRGRKALDYITENNLVPDSVVPSLAPLIPESARLFLSLPKEGGGTETVERQEADMAFPQHIVDSLILSADAFAEIFNSMRIGGETLNGTVKVKLPGRNEEQMIAFNGRLDKMLGPIVEEFLVGRDDDVGKAYRVCVINAIESPITLSEIIVFLLADPVINRWVPAVINAGALPLSLKPGEKREIVVQPIEPIPHSWGVRLKPIKAEVNLDFESLWLSVLETPGWGDITHQVTVKIDAGYFNDPNALDKVIVTFNHEEAIVELKKDVLISSIELTKPILPYLLREEEANDYFYRVNSWRKEQLVGTSILEDDSPELQIVPPLE